MQKQEWIVFVRNRDIEKFREDWKWVHEGKMYKENGNQQIDLESECIKEGRGSI